MYAAEWQIKEDETAGELYEALKVLGAGLLRETVKAIAEGRAPEVPQASIPATELKHAPKIFKEDCLINWNAPVENIYNLIRGLSPAPAAFTHLNDKTLRIFKAKKELA